MRVLGVIRRRIVAALRCRLCLPAAVALAIATAGVGYGVLYDDIVTALGASLFVPSAAILFGIASRRRGGLFDRVPRRPS